MKAYTDHTQDELAAELNSLQARYEEYKAKGLALNMARGKPGAEQLALSMPMLGVLDENSDCCSESGIDCRNYGELKGIDEARRLFGAYMGVTMEETIVLGNSSLNFMYDCMARALLKGVLGGDKPWKEYESVTFLCPVPGYDRHFAICESLGVKMVNIPMDENGPDMDMVEKLVAEDDAVKGIWCVPKYANPSGATYSDETVKRLAALKPKAKDFRIFWDNAYAEHYVYNNLPLLNILDECTKAGNPDMVYMFGSTNKITLPGAGVAFFGASKANVDFTARQLASQAISWDKLNMLRHVDFLQSIEGIRAQMDMHAAILRPRFDAVLNSLDSELAPLHLGSYERPEGGYFVCYQAPKGCAKRIVALCKQAGVVLTDAGATHPYGNDPQDSFIRIAPSFPPIEELKQAMEVFCLAAKIAQVETLL